MILCKIVYRKYYQPEIECASREQIKAWQDERLVKQGQHGWDNVPYYRQKMDARGIEPNITHKALAQLEENGMVIRIPDGTTDRFDGNVSPHAHFKCSTCGNVYDLMSFNNKSITFSDDIISHVTNYSLMAFGLCKNCNKIN